MKIKFAVCGAVLCFVVLLFFVMRAALHHRHILIFHQQTVAHSLPLIVAEPDGVLKTRSKRSAMLRRDCRECRSGAEQ